MNCTRNRRFVVLLVLCQPCLLVTGHTEDTTQTIHGGRVLTPIQDLFDPIALDGPTSIQISPDDAFVYVAFNQGDQFDVDGISVYSRNAGNGLLTFSGDHVDGVDGIDGLIGVNDIALSPDGNCLYSTGLQVIVPFNLDGHVASFSRDAGDGSLSFVQAYDIFDAGSGPLSGPGRVQVSPDNRHVYVTDFAEEAILVYGADPLSCQITLVDVAQNGKGEPVLFAHNKLALSDNGEQLYLSVGDVDTTQLGGLVVFNRDDMTGSLSYSEIHIDDTSGVDGLGFAGAIALSPNQGHLYVCGESDNAIAAFERDTLTGSLTYLQSWFDGQDGVDGLAGCDDLLVSPNGEYVIAAGGDENAIAVFGRDSSSGLLVYLGQEIDNMGGVNALNFVQSIAISQDGGNLYATSGPEDGVQVFGVAVPFIFIDGFE